MPAATNERNDAGAKVTVACKLPAGIVMRAHTPRTEKESILGGGTREYEVHRWNGVEHEIHGTAVPFGQMPKCQVVAGYALTPNVSKDLWDNWFSANREGRLVQSNLIFAYERDDMVRGKARENEKAVHGFEPIDPDNPSKKVGVRGIVKADVR